MREVEKVGNLESHHFTKSIDYKPRCIKLEAGRRQRRDKARIHDEGNMIGANNSLRFERRQGNEGVPTWAYQNAVQDRTNRRNLMISPSEPTTPLGNLTKSA